MTSAPIQVGQQAPDFELRDQNNAVVRLSDHRGAKNVLVVFYPLAFTRTCQGELAAIQDDRDTFVNDTTQVLTISVDSIFAHKVWADEQGYDFPLLADFWPHGEVARAYGVFNPGKGYADRGTFLVDRTGVVRFVEVNSPGVGRDPDVWRKALAAL